MKRTKGLRELIRVAEREGAKLLSLEMGGKHAKLTFEGPGGTLKTIAPSGMFKTSNQRVIENWRAQIRRGCCS